MQILWGAVRAVSVEAIGVLFVIWMLQGATGLAIDAPWNAWSSAAGGQDDHQEASTWAVATDWSATDRQDLASAGAIELAHGGSATGDEERATLRQWFNTLFPAQDDHLNHQPEMERRAEYAQQRLDHFSQLYGIASRN